MFAKAEVLMGCRIKILEMAILRVIEISDFQISRRISLVQTPCLLSVGQPNLKTIHCRGAHTQDSQKLCSPLEKDVEHPPRCGGIDKLRGATKRRGDLKRPASHSLSATPENFASLGILASRIYRRGDCRRNGHNRRAVLRIGISFHFNLLTVELTDRIFSIEDRRDLMLPVT